MLRLLVLPLLSTALTIGCGGGGRAPVRVNPEEVAGGPAPGASAAATRTLPPHPGALVPFVLAAGEGAALSTYRFTPDGRGGGALAELLPGFAALRVSPDGARYLGIERTGGGRQVQLRALEGAVERQLSADHCIPTFLDDSHVLACRERSDPQPADVSFTIVRIDLASGAEEPLYVSRVPLWDDFPLTLDPAGRHAALYLRDPRPAAAGIFELDLVSRELRSLAPGAVAIWWAPDGRRFAALYRDGDGRRLRLLERTADGARPLHDFGDKSVLASFVDDRFLLVVRGARPSRARLFLHDLQDHHETLIDDSPEVNNIAVVSFALVLDGGGRIVYPGRGAGGTELRTADLSVDPPRVSTLAPGRPGVVLLVHPELPR